jgi:hypothetical protein
VGGSLQPVGLCRVRAADRNGPDLAFPRGRRMFPATFADEDGTSVGQEPGSYVTIPDMIVRKDDVTFIW